MKQSLTKLSRVLVFCMMAAFVLLTGGGMTAYADGDFTIEDGMQVRCVVTDGAGNTVHSAAATITIR